MNRMIKNLLIFALAMMPFAMMAQQGDRPILMRKTSPSPQPVKCDDIVAVNSNGDVRYRDGAAQLTLRASEVAYVYKPRRLCKELLDGDAAIKAGNWAEAYKKFTEAEGKYFKMGWDANIAYNLGFALAKLNRGADAVKALEKVRTANVAGTFNKWKNADFDAALSMLVLLYAEQKNAAKVEDTVKFIISSGSGAVPAALIAQGDILYGSGKKSDAVYKYAEAALMYPESPVAPRGLCFAANTMKELGDARGISFANTLREKYPESEWISKLK